VLDLEAHNLNALPPEIGELNNLRHLNLEGKETIFRQSKLSRLPSEIKNLVNLEELNISSNTFEELSPEIFSLSNLKELKVSNNRIRELPSEVCQLTNLISLYIDWNELTAFPPEIGQLINLRILHAHHNNLTSLPASIGDLINLEMLTLGFDYVTHFDPRGNPITKRNKISKLPPEIGSLTNLKLLDLHHNELKSLPKEIMRLTSLEHLTLSENQLRIPPEILKMDEPKAIFNYYFSSEKPLNEVKILFVGQGSVGKTSLIQQILHNTFDPNQNKTEGISLHKWQTQPADNGTSTIINANIWDFGGQEIMHATHQFFLTKRSLYLLVLDARLGQDENRVEYWLRMIQSFGGDSPVIVVGNKIDQQPLDIDRRGLQAKYPNIKAFVETSCLDGRGIEELREVLAREISALPHVHDELPESWFQVKEKLENSDKDFIPYSEYEALCNEGGISDEISQQTLIGFLHDLGSVLNFRDDPRLQETNILNPEWVTNGVYRILNSNELFQNQGVLEIKQLGKMLDPKAYPRTRHMFIVDMMRKFELCYPFEGDDSKYLVPDLLPREEPFTGEWTDALAFEFHYSVLPGSIISRFIVRMNAFVYKTVWRSGVVLKSGGNTALVKADTEDKRIYIWVTGDENTRRDFLSAIRMEFAAIHKTIAKIEATEKVPLPSQPDVAPVDYEFLLRLERDNRPTFPVQAGDDIIDVDVKELLDGVRPAKNQAVKVFISYSHQDKSFAKKLANELEGQGMKVWWDFDSLKGGQDWQKEIERGIKGCDFFLVALTPDAIESEWVGNEITYASNAQKTIIPLHLKKCDVPIGLIKKQQIDFEKQTQKAAIKELLGILK
jgi:internalin A